MYKYFLVIICVVSSFIIAQGSLSAVDDYPRRTVITADAPDKALLRTGYWADIEGRCFSYKEQDWQLLRRKKAPSPLRQIILRDLIKSATKAMINSRPCQQILRLSPTDYGMTTEFLSPYIARTFERLLAGKLEKTILKLIHDSPHNSCILIALRTLLVGIKDWEITSDVVTVLNQFAANLEGNQYLTTYGIARYIVLNITDREKQLDLADVLRAYIAIFDDTKRLEYIDLNVPDIDHTVYEMRQADSFPWDVKAYLRGNMKYQKSSYAMDKAWIAHLMQHIQIGEVNGEKLRQELLVPPSNISIALARNLCSVTDIEKLMKVLPALDYLYRICDKLEAFKAFLPFIIGNISPMESILPVIVELLPKDAQGQIQLVKDPGEFRAYLLKAIRQYFSVCLDTYHTINQTLWSDYLRLFLCSLDGRPRDTNFTDIESPRVFRILKSLKDFGYTLK